MPKVTIVGAGMAGLSAALRLAERGYEVTIFERDRFVGGKFRATEWFGKKSKTHAFHEHSYHMFLNWYHNFFAIAEEIGVRDSFIPLTNVKFLYQGSFPKLKELVNFGSIASIPQNLLSGVLPIPDMFLYMYSVLDLLGTPMTQNRYRDLISINAFASEKPYSTEASVSMYDEYLAKTFAVASYLTAVKSFQTFVEYNSYQPAPLYWALTDDCFNAFLHPLQAKLERLGVKFIFGHEADGLVLDDEGNVSRITFKKLDESYSPSLSEFSQDELKLSTGSHEHEVEGPLIMAIPPGPLYNLLGPDVLNRSPELGETGKLESVPMASVHLHLNKKFAERMRAMNVKLPREPVVLVNSNYKLSFVADSKLWDLTETYLNVVASDSRPLDHLLAPPIFTYDREWKGAAHDLSLDHPVTSLDHILHEFRRFVPFEEDEIDLDLLQIDRNVGRELFINEIGSWKWRPQTRTKIKNLFLAGDFCRNVIDVVSLEGTVVSGFNAAECVRKYCGVGAPINIATPKKYPYSLFWLMKVMFAPYAVGAKAWSTCNDIVRKARI